MGGEALGPVKAPCHSVGRGMPGPGSWSGWVGEQGEERGDWRLLERKPGKAITFKM